MTAVSTAETMPLTTSGTLLRLKLNTKHLNQSISGKYPLQNTLIYCFCRSIKFHLFEKDLIAGKMFNYSHKMFLFSILLYCLT